MTNRIKFIAFDDSKKEELVSMLSSININPYIDYYKFKTKIEDQITSSHFPQWFKHICDDINADISTGICVHYLENCPIDKFIPTLDIYDPRTDKLSKKKTFISEAFLEMFSQLRDTPIFAYETRNKGDFFQDVYPWTKFIHTNTVRAKGSICWHNDRTAHSVRAGYLYLLALKIPDGTNSLTNYVHNEDIRPLIRHEEIGILQQKHYCTDFDDISKAFNKTQDISEKHAIFEHDNSIRFYESNTRALNHDAANALESFKKALADAPKTTIKINNSCMLCIPNKLGLHNRELGTGHMEGDVSRWLLKTYNFTSSKECDGYRHLFKENNGYLIAEL